MASSGVGVRASQKAAYQEDDASFAGDEEVYQDGEEQLSAQPSTAPSDGEVEDVRPGATQRFTRPAAEEEDGDWEADERGADSEQPEGDLEELDGSPSEDPRRGSPTRPRADAWPGAQPDSPQPAAAGKQDRRQKLDRSRQPEFEGDLSEWGRTAVDGFYDDEDDQSTSSHPTLSSGLGPRSNPVKPFDLLAAKETLAYNAGMYSRAQVLRRDGTAPSAMGIADDLPTRLAYQQLHVLAGMAGKVQSAILHNKRIFEQRILMEDRALQRRVLAAWREKCCASAAKEAKLKKAVGRLTKGTLARAFYAWRDAFHLVDKTHAMKRKLTVVLARGLMRRTWEAWRLLCRERSWKNQYLLREREVQLLEAKIRGYERRPIQVLRKRRMRVMLLEWFGQARERRARRLRTAKAVKYFGQATLVKAWNSWRQQYLEAKRRQVLVKKVAGRIANLQLAAAWSAWRELLAAKKELSSKLQRGVRFWLQSSVAKAFNTWRAYLAQKKEERRIAMRWMQPAKSRAFAAWVELVTSRKRNRLLVGRAVAKMQRGMLLAAWDAWRERVVAKHMETSMSSKEDMETMLKELRAQNERLRRDNERFVRLIDSGEWGRGRVAELVTAGEVMKSERDALLKLISSLRREYEAVQAAKGAQEHELRSLKERLSVGGPARNRMLVKGGSSFNALVRAMKQDLISAGTAAKDPTLLYEIDKLSMEHVQVFPDGELNVLAVTSSSPGATSSTAPGRSSTPLARPSGSPGPSGRLSAGSVPTQMSPPLALASAYSTASPSSSSPLRAAPQPGVGAGGGGDGGGSHTQQILAALQSLSPAEVDRLERAVKQDPRLSGGGGAPGSPGALGGGGRPVGSSLRRGR